MVPDRGGPGPDVVALDRVAGVGRFRLRGRSLPMTADQVAQLSVRSFDIGALQAAGLVRKAP